MIILFRSGTSHEMLMVTSLWHRRSLHPHGLVPNSKGLRCQFRGDWSQRMASLTSKSDSNTSGSEETQHHYIIHAVFFSVSLRTWIASLWIQKYRWHLEYGVITGCVSIICYFRLFVNLPFVARQWLLWRKVTNCKCGSSFVYNY